MKKFEAICDAIDGIKQNVLVLFEAAEGADAEDLEVLVEEIQDLKACLNQVVVEAVAGEE